MAAKYFLTGFLLITELAGFALAFAFHFRLLKKIFDSAKFKNIRYWLKAGLTGIIIPLFSLLLMLVLAISGLILGKVGLTPLIAPIAYFYGYLLFFICLPTFFIAETCHAFISQFLSSWFGAYGKSLGYPAAILLGFTITSIIYFFIGALVGQYRENRKKKTDLPK